MTTAYQKVAGVYKQAAQVAKGTSNEPNALLQWASAAQSANDVATAITAYQRFLKVAPDNPNAAGGQADARAAPGVRSRSRRVRLPRSTSTRTG